MAAAWDAFDGDYDVAYDDAEPPTVNADGECIEWAQGLLCGRSDCADCGRDVAQQLRDGATTWPGLLALVREAGRIIDGYGSRPPEGAVTDGDVAAIVTRMLPADLSPLGHEAARAWADGLIEAVAGYAPPSTEAACFPVSPTLPHPEAVMLRWSYALGRLTYAWALVGARLRERRERGVC